MYHTDIVWHGVDMSEYNRTLHIILILYGMVLICLSTKEHYVSYWYCMAWCRYVWVQ